MSLFYSIQKSSLHLFYLVYIITLFLTRVTQCIYHVPFNIKFFLKRNYHKTLMETSIVVLIFAAWFPIEVLSAVSKVNNVLKEAFCLHLSIRLLLY